MIGYQELLTSGLSWFYRKIPRFVKKISITANFKFYSDYGVSFEQFEPWFPKAMIPQHFHVKFWTRPMNCPTGGNLTRPQAPPDDLFYLIKTGKIIPKGKVASFDTDGVIFADGSREDVDTIIFNTGYQPGSSSIRFPNDWQYKHQDLYKGCLHADIPNLAFVGLVRPTIGSIPAMAEMHSRIIAAYLSEQVPLPDLEQRQSILAADNARHQAACPHMHERFPHIFFFDEWLDQMAEIIGGKPKLRQHLSSVADLRAYFFGSPMPLRFRMHGDGTQANARETYSKRVAKVWGNAFGKWAAATVLTHLFIPYLLTLIAFLIPYVGYGLPLIVALLSAAAFHFLYRTVDLFRYVFETSIARTVSIAFGVFFIKKIKNEMPNYQEPSIFQRLD
jgi:dimethylaniline monooxygenase (N-oxide forming)